MDDLNKVPGRRGRPKKEETVAINENVPADTVQQEAIPQAKEANTPEYNIEVIRDYYGAVDPFYLSKKNPEYEYRFLRDDHKNLSLKTTNMLFQKGGWQMVDRKHALTLGLNERDISPDGLVRRGDTVLAFMPKKFYEEKDEYSRKKANEPISMVKRMVKDGDASIGGKEIHQTMKGIQTQKQLGM